jgi:hypothetical protein
MFWVPRFYGFKSARHYTTDGLKPHDLGHLICNCDVGGFRHFLRIDINQADTDDRSSDRAVPPQCLIHQRFSPPGGHAGTNGTKSE